MSRSWSSAHDWKSCKGQKLFESSNLSISATSEQALHRLLRLFYFNKMSERARAAAPPLQTEPSSLGNWRAPRFFRHADTAVHHYSGGVCAASFDQHPRNSGGLYLGYVDMRNTADKKETLFITFYCNPGTDE